MQTWAKRGIQTALVTGGLLMLGTGIASAEENVDPDAPAGPIDLNVSVPVQIEDNAIGTPVGQVDVPGYDGEISTKPVTDVVNKAVAPAAEAAAPAAKAAEPVTEPLQKAASDAGSKLNEAAHDVGSKAQQAGLKAQDATGSEGQGNLLPAPAAGDAKADEPKQDTNGDPALGNKVQGNVAVPIQITGNAISVLGEAKVDSDAEQSYEHDADVSTDGSGGGLAGNAVNLDWALPVQIAGNAGALGGSAEATGTATQSAATTGDTETDGSEGALAGNIVSPQFATPVQLAGNAVAGPASDATTEFDGATAAQSGGSLATDGDESFGSGNIGGGPLALPLRVANNGLAGGGQADAKGSSAVFAEAGDSSTDSRAAGSDKTTTTSGEDATLAGNVVQPKGAGLGSITGTAGAVLGSSNTDGTSSDATMTAGPGKTITSGKNGVLSANAADAPVALPAELFGTAASAGGNASAVGHENTTVAEAGDATRTNGDDSFGSANLVSAPIGATAEAFGLAGTAVGTADAQATEDKTVDAGGYNGTTGNDAFGSGNLVQTPVAAPVETLGNAVAAVGNGTGSAEETKVVTAGGGGNTQDDNGVLSANLVSAPASTPAQLFGSALSGLGTADGHAITDTISDSGDGVHADGTAGTGAGNIGFVPVSLPAQVHGLSGGAFGQSTATSDNLTDSLAGGDANSTGEAGSIAGNIVQVPFGSAAGVFGLGAAGGGETSAQSVHDVVSEAGGDTATNGESGALAGNVVSGQALPVAEVFGDAVSALGVVTGDAQNTTDVSSGGDIETAGDDASISGNIVDAPVGAVAQAFGTAGTVFGWADATADNTTDAEVGGDTDTSGEQSLSGVDAQLPVGALAQVYDLPLEVLYGAMTDATDATDVQVADEAPGIDLPITGSELGATELPGMSSVGAMRSDEAPSGSYGPVEALQGVSSGFVDGVSSVGAPALPTDLADMPLDVNTLPVELPAGELPTGQLPTDLPIGELPTGELPTGQLPIGELPTELPFELPTNGLPTDLPTNLPAELPTDLASVEPGSLAPGIADPAAGSFSGVLDSVSLSGVSLGA